jgi:hypothetical protein
MSRDFSAQGWSKSAARAGPVRQDVRAKSRARCHDRSLATRPTAEDETQRMRLTAIDHVFTGPVAYPIEFLLVYAGRLPLETLASGLAAALPEFTPLRMTLAKATPDTYELVEAPMPRLEVGAPRASGPSLDAIDELRPLVGGAGSQPGEPLARFRATYVGDETWIGVSISHAVVDGFSFFFFLTAWAARTRREPARKPVLDRGPLLLPAAEPAVTRALTRESLLERTGVAWCGARAQLARSMRWSVRRLSHETVATLQREAAEASAAVGGPAMSLNDWLTAALWQEQVARWPETRLPQRLTCAFDFRRVYPAVPANFFGNGIVAAGLTIEREELLALPRRELAQRIRGAVAAVGPNVVTDTVACLEGLRLERGLGVIDELDIVDPERGFVLTNMSRLPLAPLDFGGGAPRALRILTTAPRTAFVLPDPAGVLLQLWS